jgi:hypothetical protein
MYEYILMSTYLWVHIYEYIFMSTYLWVHISVMNCGIFCFLFYRYLFQIELLTFCWAHENDETDFKQPDLININIYVYYGFKLTSN